MANRWRRAWLGLALVIAAVGVMGATADARGKGTLRTWAVARLEGTFHVKGKIVVCEGVFATNGTCSKSQKVEQWFRFKPMCAKGACKRVKVTIKGRNGTLQGTAVLHRHNATTPQGVDGIPDWELPIKGKLRDVKCGDGSEAAALSDYTFFAREARNGRATKISATLFERPSGRSVGPYFFPDNTTCPSFKEFIEFGPQPGGSSNGGGA